MNKENIKKRIEKLRQEINRHRYLYHVLDKEEITDAALDSLKNELYQLEMENPEFITPDSPTQRIGGQPLNEFKKVKHSQPMMSLFDAFSEEDIKDWENRLIKILKTTSPFGHLVRLSAHDEVPLVRGGKPRTPPLLIYPDFHSGAKEGIRGGYFCELKLDGLAVSLVYKKSNFILGATRGDGVVGEEVTQNLKTIEAIPLTLRRPQFKEFKSLGLDEESIKKLEAALSSGTIEVRGEAIMTNKVLNQLNQIYKKQGKPLLANTRNAAAGSIRQLDSKLTAARKLDFYVWSLVTNIGLEKHEQEMAIAKLLGFKVLKHNKYCGNINEVIAFHHYWEKNREKLDFNCDGIVVKVNNLDLWPGLGFVGKGPRFMMAYKFPAFQGTTIVEGVVWQVGRTGVLTPTAVLKPVKIYGVTISRATLHNLDEIKRLDLKIGDTVIVERAGDVIPKVVKVLPKLRTGREKEIKVPVKCPRCGGKVIKIPGEVAYRCANLDCYAINLRRLFHWASKSAMDIDGLGPKIIEQLVKQGLVRDQPDFYKLSVDDLKPLERFADKSAENLIKAIEEKKEVDLPRFIYSLGIRHIGEESALALAKHFGSLEKIKNASLEEINGIYDFGGVMAKSVYGWFQNKNNQKLLDKLIKLRIKVRSQKLSPANQVLAGKTFVLTGTLDGLTRDKAKVKIRELGGEISSSVSKNTDYLVAGAEPGSKLEKAEKLGVKIINEDEFIKFIS